MSRSPSSSLLPGHRSRADRPLSGGLGCVACPEYDEYLGVAVLLPPFFFSTPGRRGGGGGSRSCSRAVLVWRQPVGVTARRIAARLCDRRDRGCADTAFWFAPQARYPRRCSTRICEDDQRVAPRGAGRRSSPCGFGLGIWSKVRARPSPWCFFIVFLQCLPGASRR